MSYASGSVWHGGQTRRASENGQGIQQPSVLVRCHPQDFLFSHWPLELAVAGMDSVVDEGKPIALKHERLQAAALPAAKQEDSMLVEWVQMKLALYEGGQLVNSLAHIRIVWENPDIFVMRKIKGSKHSASPRARIGAYPVRSRPQQ